MSVVTLSFKISQWSKMLIFLVLLNENQTCCKEQHSKCMKKQVQEREKK